MVLTIKADVFIETEASLLLNTSDESPDIGFNYENFMMNTPNIKAKSVDELVSVIIVY